MKFIEDTISFISPKWARDRAIAKQQIDFLNKTKKADTSDTGNYVGPYSGGAGSRISSPWFISQKDPQFRYISQVALRNMRDRARTIVTSNEVAAGLLNTTVDNVIGPKGFQLQVTANNDQWTPEKNEAWRNQAQKLMDGWFPYADISGLSWTQHQKLVLRSMLRDGDIGVILDKDGFLQGIEGDLIATPPTPDDTKTIYFGVEVDSFNNPQAFYVLPLADGATQPDPIRVEAKDFIFLSNITRFGQLRGETVFASVFDTLDQISQWKLATLVAARIAACFSIAITREDNSAVFAGLPGTNTAGQTQSQINIEPGMVQYLNKGESITPINPANPGHNFPSNLMAMLRLAGVPFGLPIELVMLNYEKSSYATARAALQQAYNRFKSHQQFFIDRYLSRVYRWRISKFIKAGLLEANPNAFDHLWVTEQFPFLDPVKEYQAIGMALDLGLVTLSQELTAKGTTLDKHIAIRGAEIKKLQEANIPQLHTQNMLPYGPVGTAPAEQPVDAEEVDPTEDEDYVPDDSEDEETTDTVEGE